LVASQHFFTQQKKKRVSLVTSPVMPLLDGNTIPQLGLGVYKVDNEIAAPLVSHALNNGYRLIDTASMYENEVGVGQGIRDSGVPREEVLVATKFWMDDLGFENTLKAFDKSLKLLGLEYLDLYLIHWPAPKRGLLYVDSWKAMEKLKNEGLIRSIGVCNFHTHHIDEILKVAEHKPVLNQVELHPWLTQDKVLDYDNSHKIVTQAWSPLARGKILEEEMLATVGSKYEKSVAQVVLRWHIQRGVAVIPKSNSKDRIVENMNVFDFELSDEEMAAISALNSGFRTGVDPEDRN
jgi:2,5-diketo-D-gluconate reductase A